MVALDRDKLTSLFDQAGLDSKIDDISVIVEAKLRNGDPVTLYCKYAESEITNLPKFFLPEDQWKKYYGLPHVDWDKAVCAFDHTSSTVDPRYFEEAMVSVALKAIETLNNTISGECYQDFLDELQVYWGAAGAGGIVDAFIEKWPSKAKGLYSFLLRDDIKSALLGICQKADFESMVRLSSIGELGLDSSFFEKHLAKKSLYIPFNKPIPCPVKKSVRDWFLIIKECTDYIDRYERFIKSDSRDAVKSLIVCNIPGASNSETIIAFSHPAWPQGVKADMSELIEGSYGFEEIATYIVNNVSQARLFKRGGNGLINSLNACLIGCGSLGGHLATALVDSGVVDYMLVDKDILSVDNIARHTCGYESVGLKKVEALKRKIEGHNPNCVCKTYDVDAMELLEGNRNVLDEADCIFITAADYPLESQFLNVFNSGGLNTPLVIMWMEPYSLAAHAIVLNKPQDLYETELYDSDTQFVRRLVLNASRLYKRDSGCNSMFMPYSGLDTQAFVIEFVRRYFEECKNNPDSNFLFSWIGAVSKARKYGAVLSEGWQGAPDYSSYSVVIG